MTKPKREPGKPGRKPGTPNRKTLELTELLQARFGENWSPILALAEIANDKNVPLDLRVRCLESVAPYMHSKRAPIREAGGDAAGGLELLIAMATNATPRAPLSPPTRFCEATGVALPDDAPALRRVTPTPAAPAAEKPPPRAARLNLDLPPAPIQRDHNPYGH